VNTGVVVVGNLLPHWLGKGDMGHLMTSVDRVPGKPARGMGVEARLLYLWYSC
jgi:hypothetical protein